MRDEFLSSGAIPHDEYISATFLPLILPMSRQITQALSIDERGERMEALELYNKALTTLRSGLATLCRERGEDAGMRETRAKMER